MYALLASFALLAAAETAPAPIKLIPDPEVPQYLKANQGEVIEWGKALQQLEKGQQRLQQGNSILNAPRVTTTGAFQETPEQVKARAQKIIDEGNQKEKKIVHKMMMFIKKIVDKIADKKNS